MKWLYALVLVSLLVAPPALADLENGVAALERGDYETALRELRPLAEQGDADAQTALGIMYYQGQGVAQDYGEAAKWYRKAARQGDAWAQTVLGFMYADGRGVTQDYAEAVKWYREAAEQGDADAQTMLANMYADGRGAAQNYAEAAKWYRRAAEQSDADAQVYLGFMYAEGQGVPRDYVLAYMWANLAGAQGNEYATELRDVVAERMTGEQIAKAQRLAREWSPSNINAGSESAEEGPAESPAFVVETEEQVIEKATLVAEKARDAAAKAIDAADGARGVAAKARDAAKNARDVTDRKRKEFRFGEDSYIGEARDGIPHGYGVLSFSSGSRYEGEFRDGNYDGYGVYEGSDGGRQEALFRDDEANGHGVEYYPGGDRYEGELRDDRKNGYGVYYADDGGRYEGELRNGRKNGYGVYYFANGDRYDGRFRDGDRNGYGLHYSSGDAYYGYFENSEPDPNRFAFREGVEAPAIGAAEPGRLIPIDETYTASGNTNVRESPDVSSRRVTTLSKGAGIRVTGKVRGKNWYAVERDGDHLGYVRADLLEPDEPSSQASSSRPSEASSSGTGFYVSKVGHILTNAHVVEGCRNVAVQTIGASPQDTYVVSRDRSADLALLKSSTRPSHVAKLRSGQSIRVGNDVIAFGFPLSGLLSNSGNVTKGSVTALSGLEDRTSQLQISAPVQAGNSGGPLIDISGHVVGVIVGKLSALKIAEITGDLPQNINFAIKRRIVEEFLDSNGVDYITARSTARLDAADIADVAKKFTVKVLCWE